MNAVDTNVLIYAWDPRDPVKQQTANDLLDAITDGILLWQVAIEFLAASRKLVPFGFNLTAAFDEIRDTLTVWKLVTPNENILDSVEDLIARFSLAFWDALVIAGSLEAGADRLYSEDFTGYPNIDGMDIINPFATP